LALAKPQKRADATHDRNAAFLILLLLPGQKEIKSRSKSKSESMRLHSRAAV